MGKFLLGAPLSPHSATTATTAQFSTQRNLHCERTSPNVKNVLSVAISELAQGIPDCFRGMPSAISLFDPGQWQCSACPRRRTLASMCHSMAFYSHENCCDWILSNFTANPPQQPRFALVTMAMCPSSFAQVQLPSSRALLLLNYHFLAAASRVPPSSNKLAIVRKQNRLCNFAAQ